MGGLPCKAGFGASGKAFCNVSYPQVCVMNRPHVSLIDCPAQVGAATPMMAGVFSILKGCGGVEELAIKRALHFLGGAGGGGRNPGASFMATRGGQEAATATAEEEEAEEWRSHREASMAVLVQRAMSTSTSGPGQGREGAAAVARFRAPWVRKGAGAGTGRSGGGKNAASAYRSRRLQVG